MSWGVDLHELPYYDPDSIEIKRRFYLSTLSIVSPAVLAFHQSLTASKLMPAFAIPRFLRRGSRQRETEKSTPRRNRHILFSVDRKRHRRRIHPRAALEMPERPARSGFERNEVSFRVPREDQPARP